MSDGQEEYGCLFFLSAILVGIALGTVALWVIH